MGGRVMEMDLGVTREPEIVFGLVCSALSAPFGTRVPARRGTRPRSTHRSDKREVQLSESEFPLVVRSAVLKRADGCRPEIERL